MKNIRMVDLKGQYDKIKNEIDHAISEVITSTAFIKGAQVKRFKEELEEYLGVKHVVPCANGTDALQIALMSLGLQEGDEVITTGFTFIATVEVVALLKLKPVIVDVDPKTFTISPDEIRKAVTKRTKAIVPVHLYGQCAEMEEINKIAKEHNLYVIEDNAQAIGADYIFSDGTTRKAGTLGDFGTTSFFPSKNLGCYGDGGALFTNNDRLAEKATAIANHGMKKKYLYEDVGINSRLDTIQAAILSVKLKYLNQYIKARQEAATFYDKKFENHPIIVPPSRADFSTHVFHQYTIKLENTDREKFRQYLSEKNIPSMVYYPFPLHTQKPYAHFGYKEGDFPVTEKLCKTVVSLPIHTEMSSEQLEYITETIRSYFTTI
ncbi:MAG: transcriptional regulator [Bacteroidia bacterium]|nr:MAG: transcriptional regulator [Bacteroidia bacterium]